ncbi:MAG: phosphopantetheine-binding protein [Chloroflexi bacterium]|nr:phosphopantetheine-binding protein [Chloroflexota bacterium]
MNRAEIFQVIKANVQVVIEGSKDKDITEANSMRDYGADSLEIVEVVSRSMKQLRIKVPRTELLDAQNLGDLVTIFERAATRVLVS